MLCGAKWEDERSKLVERKVSGTRAHVCVPSNSTATTAERQSSVVVLATRKTKKNDDVFTQKVPCVHIDIVVVGSKLTSLIFCFQCFPRTLYSSIRSVGS